MMNDGLLLVNTEYVAPPPPPLPPAEGPITAVYRMSCLHELRAPVHEYYFIQI